MPHDATTFHVIWRHVTSSHDMPRHAKSCCGILRKYIMLQPSTSCYAMPWQHRNIITQIILHHAMAFHTILWLMNAVLFASRTSFSVHVLKDSVEVVTKEGKSLRFSYEREEMRDFIMTQVRTSTSTNTVRTVTSTALLQLPCWRQQLCVLVPRVLLQFKRIYTCSLCSVLIGTLYSAERFSYERSSYTWVFCYMHTFIYMYVIIFQ